jgi:hypothetical protein
MGIPTHEDAAMMIELFKLRMEPFMQESEHWFNMEFQPGSWEELKERYPLGSRE